MLDNDHLTYTQPKRDRLLSPERSLITQERAQKLDLLIHLLTNLQQSLVICGPDGIGKTTLLQQLASNRHESWHFCPLQGSPALSFEDIMQQLGQSLGLGNALKDHLSSIRSCCEQRKVILAIDDAEHLVPGLANELIGLADSLSGLRVVLAMNYDAYHLKCNTDKALDDCHLIEIPPLNRKQCFDFLQNVSAQPNATLHFSSITDDWVDALYRSTHGIPGKLLAEFPTLEHPQNRHPWVLWCSVISLLAVFAFLASSLLLQPLFNLPNPDTPNITDIQAPDQGMTPTAATHSSPSASDTLPAPASLGIGESLLQATPGSTLSSTELSPVTATPKDSGNQLQTPLELSMPISDTKQIVDNTLPGQISTLPPNDKSPVATTKKHDEQTLPESIPPLTPTKEKPQPLAKIEAVTPKKLSETVASASSATTLDDTAWINDQSGNRYTLQVMTLSTRDAVRRFMLKYRDYGESLKYYIVDRGDQQKYIVIYGSFESASEARQYKEVMPGEFKQALEKRFSSIHKNRR